MVLAGFLESSQEICVNRDFPRILCMIMKTVDTVHSLMPLSHQSLSMSISYVHTDGTRYLIQGTEIVLLGVKGCICVAVWSRPVWMNVSQGSF